MSLLNLDVYRCALGVWNNVWSSGNSEVSLRPVLELADGCPSVSSHGDLDMILSPLSVSFIVRRICKKNRDAGTGGNAFPNPSAI
jgi:hypothetical protein